MLENSHTLLGNLAYGFRPEGARQLPGASSPWKSSLPSPQVFLLFPPGGRTSLSSGASSALRAEKEGGWSLPTRD